jgi:hypothetical protein
MSEIWVDRDCSSCGQTVAQIVFFEAKEKEIEILAYRVNCPFCLKFLEEPTPEEVRNAIIIKREKQTAHSQGFGENSVPG